MAKFITLTGTNGEGIAIDAERVVALQGVIERDRADQAVLYGGLPKEIGTKILMTGLMSPVEARELRSEVVSLMTSALA